MPPLDPASPGIIMLSDQLTLNKQLSYEKGATDDDQDCVVCKSTFKDGDHVRMLPCRHVYHRRCFDGWLHQYKFNCPICRYNLISDERVALTERRVGSQLISWFSLR
ncbi:Zinc finger, RING-type [Sesbania bispinosa]|nr:Zinc finger, RING-type [Sesbania bispinosa]